MNMKNRLIQALLKVAKKHKVMTYPVLALVAIISFFGYFFSWSHGTGKRVVAIVMIMVMLVSQSYFLTSSATTSQDGPEALITQEKLQRQGDDLISEDSPEENSLIVDSTENTNDDTKSTQSGGDTDVEGNTPANGETKDVNGTTVENTENVGREETPAADETEKAGSNENQTTLVEGETSIGKETSSDNGTASLDIKNTAMLESGDSSTADSKSVEYVFYYEDDSGYRQIGNAYGTVTSTDKEGDTYLYNLSNIANQLTASINSDTTYTHDLCYEFSDKWYYYDGGDEVTDLAQVTARKVADNIEMIRLCCKRTLKYYKAYIYPNGTATYDVSYSDVTSGDNNIYRIPVESDLVIENISRTGYTFTTDSEELNVTGGTVLSMGENSVTVTPDSTSATVSITLAWTPNTYEITYAKDENGTEFTTQSVTYDGDEHFYGDEIVKKKEGYAFKTWRIGENGNELADDIDTHKISEYQDDLYNDGKRAVLYPVYTYDGFGINKEEIVYEYKKSGETLIQGSYENSEKSESGNFTYAIASDDSGKSALESLGVQVEVLTNGIKVSTDGPTGTTGDSPIPLKITITDRNAPAGEQEKEFTVNVSINPRQVEIAAPADGSATKTYDGTTTTYLQSPLSTDVDGVTVTFTGSSYNSPDVADADKINLTGVTLNVPDGEDSKNYKLKEESVEGSIVKRVVYLNTSAQLPDGVEYVRAGEENPEFIVVEDTSTNSYDSKTGTLNGIGELGTITFSTDRPEDLTVAGEYEITAVDVENANYRVIFTGTGTFQVVMEAPVEDKNYTIIGTTGSAGWYILNPAQVSVVSECGYDTVRISNDGGKTYKSARVIDISESDFSKDSGLSIQLYDSQTHAVTSWQDISVKVDQTAPEFISYSLSQTEGTFYDSSQPVPGGLYFPSNGRMLTFGNYFNKTVNVTLTYKDTASGLSTLHYGLYGEEPIRTMPFGSTDENGYATVTFEILPAVLEQAGEITFYAADIAGNKEGAKRTLQRDGTTEWSVETTGPELTFYVMAGEKQSEYVVSDSEKYYSNCTAFLGVSDTVSGIYSVTWYINDVEYDEDVLSNSKQTEAEFRKNINEENFSAESGYYSIYAVATDNAGNETTTNTINFMVDDDAPVVDITTDYNAWLTNVKLEFETYDDLSGIREINVTDTDSNVIEYHVEKGVNGIYECYFDITEKGTYYIIVSDKAGNITKKEIVIDKVSNEIPACPDISFDPEEADGEDGWYRRIPDIRLSNITKTTDDTPVITKYQVWKDGEDAGDEVSLTDTESSALIPIGDGIYNLKAWSESVTGIQCEGVHEYQIKVDTVSPKIDFTTTKDSGSTILVDFTVTDYGSGVDAETIKVMHGGKEILAKTEQTDDGYKGSFVVSETGSYSIQASDIAGNPADVAAFTPMSMKVKAVTNISANSATLGANVIKGTFDITAATISYRKITEDEYMEAEAVVNKDESTGNLALSAVLSGLNEAIAYAYKITAVSEAGEVLEYEGYFKTLSSSEAGISVVGTARYADGAKGTITVGLFEGNVCRRAIEINANEEFIFDNVPDGNYNIVATDGIYSKTMRVLIKNGVMIYPEGYIDLVLSGKNTSVVITTSDTPDITADNMDSIFDYDVINFTSDDQKLIEVGGTVEFRLYATLMSVASVSANEISAMYSVTDKNKIVGAYLDLSLYKIVTDRAGNVERSRVTELANGANVSVTIPLGELSGKTGLEVIRIHDTGDGRYFGASLADEDYSPDTYTITTNQFSTYAVLYSKESEPTTQEENVNSPGTAGGNENENTATTTEENKNNGTDKDNNSSKNITSKDKASTNAKGTTNASSVGSLRSSSTAQTGDETPIAVMGTVMMLAAAVFFVLRKKQNNLK